MDINTKKLQPIKLPPRKLPTGNLSPTKLHPIIPPSANLPPRYPVRRIAPIQTFLPITPYMTRVDSLNNPMAIYNTVIIPAPSAEVQSELRNLGL
jgi:hypothetical protein